MSTLDQYSTIDEQDENYDSAFSISREPVGTDFERLVSFVDTVYSC